MEREKPWAQWAAVADQLSLEVTEHKRAGFLSRTRAPSGLRGVVDGVEVEVRCSWTRVPLGFSSGWATVREVTYGTRREGETGYVVRARWTAGVSDPRYPRVDEAVVHTVVEQAKIAPPQPPEPPLIPRWDRWASEIRYQFSISVSPDELREIAAMLAADSTEDQASHASLCSLAAGDLSTTADWLRSRDIVRRLPPESE